MIFNTRMIYKKIPGFRFSLWNPSVDRRKCHDPAQAQRDAIWWDEYRERLNSLGQHRG